MRKITRRGWEAVLAAALMQGPRASGQQALISALSIDRSITPSTNAPVNWGPDQALLGPVKATFGAYAGAQYNDNINASEFTPESDTILNVGLDFGLVWPATDNSALDFAAGLGYVQYLRHSADSGLVIAPNSALTWQIKFGDATLSLYDQISYLQQGVQDAALANVVTLPRLDNTTGARMSWEPEHLLLQAGYSYDYFVSPSTTYNYLDRDSQYFFTRDAWRFAESTQAGIEGSLSLTHYLESSLPSSRSLSVGPYGQWQVTQSLLATARVGEVLNFFDSSGSGMLGSTLSSYYFGLNIVDYPAAFLTDSVSVTRETALGINQGSGYVEQTTATGSFSLSLTPRISVDGYVTYQKGNQPLELTVVDRLVLGVPFILAQENFKENFEFYGGGPTLTWRITDKLASHLNYSCWRRVSNLSGRRYLQNSVSLNLGYTFW